MSSAFFLFRTPTSTPFSRRIVQASSENRFRFHSSIEGSSLARTNRRISSFASCQFTEPIFSLSASIHHCFVNGTQASLPSLRDHDWYAARAGSPRFFSYRILFFRKLSKYDCFSQVFAVLCRNLHCIILSFLIYYCNEF